MAAQILLFPYIPPPGPQRSVFGKAMVNRLIDVAADFAGIEREQLLGKSKVWEIAYTRFAVVYVAHQHGKSLSHIARIMGYRDHTSAIHAFRRAIELEASEPEFAQL